MKRISKLLFFSLLILTLLLSSQVMAEDTEEVEVIVEGEKIPLEDFQMPSFNRGFKANGGPQVNYLHLDLSDLNDLLEEEGFASLREDMILFGGGGKGGFRLGSRFGGYGVQGELSSTNSGQKAILELDYGGFLYEHGVYAENNADIAWGFLAGKGNAEFIRIYNQNPEDTNEATATHLSKDFVTLKPKISIDYRFAPFIGINFSAGYLLSYGGEWDHYGISTDEPDINFSGPSASLKLNFGF